MFEFIDNFKGLATDIILVGIFIYYLISRDKLYAKSLETRDKIYDNRLGKMTELFTETAKEGHEVAGKLGETMSDLRAEIARKK